MSSEIVIQSTAFQWAWNTYPATRRCLFHVPNGGSRNKIEAMQFKAAGEVPGIPDMLFIWNRKLYAFEFKTTIGRLSPAQQQVHTVWQSQGIPVTIIRSVEDFKIAFTQIINNSL